MRMIDHGNVIRLFECFESEKEMQIVLELVTGGELFDRLVDAGNYTEKDAARCMYSLCDALQHLHAHQIAHRDLKPENILYGSSDSKADIKLTDFGLSQVNSRSHCCPMPAAIAPH